MEKHDFDLKISDVSRTILSYCISRTSNTQDAEDLAQDIILEILKSSQNIRDDKAFYGFLWAVAGNVYKQWYKKKLKINECELTDDVHDEDDVFIKMLDDNSDIYLLRRELSLLSEKYRRATIFYYLENKSCSEISKLLSISESMVKYLLFKSRKILKEGMSMERNYGEQSYNPKKLTIMFWGNGSNRFSKVCEKKIPQNILLACYNDSLTGDEISLQIGVALPYLEDDLNNLLEYDLLAKNGNKYSTNIVIFTEEFSKEIDIKTASLRKELSKIVESVIVEKETAIRNIGFIGCNMSKNIYAWQIMSIILYQSIIEKLQKNIHVDFPQNKFGDYCFVWGSEGFEENIWDSQFGFGISNVTNDNGDYMQFMDFPINGEMVHHYYYNRKPTSNVYFDIANGIIEKFSENDLTLVADMVKKGYVKINNGTWTVNVPVFTKTQFSELLKVLDNISNEISKKAEEILETVSKILLNHTPSNIKSLASKMAYLRLFEDAISAPVKILYTDGVIKPVDKTELLPTTYIILNK